MAKKRNKFRSIQKILSAYTKKKGISPGKDFNKVASSIYKANPKMPLSEIKKRIGKLYNNSKRSKKKVSEKKIPFPPFFYFYYFEDEVAKEIFEGVEVNVVFPQMPEFDFSALQLDAMEMFTSSGLKAYLRANYNGTPNIASFRLEDTDSKTTVTYLVDIGEVEAEPNIIPEKISTEGPIASTSSPDIKDQIRLQELIEKNRIEGQKQIERIAKLEAKYKKQGYSNKQIMKLLGL